MSNMDIRTVKEIFARLFVIAVQYRMHFLAFTKSLEKSKFISKVEKNRYDEYFNESLEDIFFDITNVRIDKDNSFGVYNDAYWCGYTYFELYLVTGRSFAFIFLKLPMSKMMDLYPIYHEMDFSSLLEYFYEMDNSKTILRLLCEEKRCSLSKLSLETGISKTTLAKYNSSDESLYKASFNAIYKISMYFNVPISMFYNDKIE